METLIEKLSHVVKDNIKTLKAVSGGCINETYKVKTSSDHSYFVKHHQNAQVMFHREAMGLKELSKSEFKIPEVIHCEDNFLVLEWTDLQSQGDKELLGKLLARMHQLTSDTYGLKEDNFIGDNPQPNKLDSDWVKFYQEQRLGFQKSMIKNHPQLKDKIEQLMELTPEIIGAYEKPSLIHGDLWSGNYAFSAGRPCLYDPAVYYADREAEIAMLLLFGCDSEVLKGYEQEYPLRQDWRERLEFYQLYHILNHYNLFGGHYGDQALGIINKYLKKF